MNEISTHRYISWMVILVVLAAVLWGASVLFNNRNTPSTPEILSTPLRTPPPQPTLTPKRTVKAIGTQTFSLLVSYTDQGFEPKSASVKKGDMVRFVNNSTQTMWITTEGKSCGAGVVDTCKALPPGEYWEFTFSTAGTKSFTEKATGAQGSIVVQ